jgi:drug/metabolite transporter (DMT)-like permease
VAADTPGAAPQALPPRSEALLWVIFVTLATATQLTFKWAGSQLRDQEPGLAFVKGALATPSVWVAIVGYIAMFALWINILQRVPLSRAYLITAIVYAPASLGAWLIFGEQISLLRTIGIALIMIGVALIAADAGETPSSSDR